jgi:ArsR family transcriptional regulator
MEDSPWSSNANFILIFFDLSNIVEIIRKEFSMKNEYWRVFRVFSDATRIRVLELLSAGEQCACILLEDIKISQPTLSHHMKILCDSGLVKCRRAGKWNYYSINADGCKYGSRLLNLLADHKMDQLLSLAWLVHLFFSPFRKKSRLPNSSAESISKRNDCCTL